MGGSAGRRWPGWVGVLLLLGGCGARPAVGAEGEVPLQLFSTIDRATVAQGVVFALEVVVFATPGSPEAAAQVTEAFRAAGFTGAPDALQFVRAEPLTERTEGDGEGNTVLVLEQRFLFRARSAGETAVPVWRLHLGARTYETPPHRILVYELGSAFYDVARAVLPIVARSRTPDGYRIFARIGSAFVVGPDALVTAYHVILDASDVRVTLPDGRQVRLRKVWTIDAGRDVAVLYIDPRHLARAGLTALRLAPLDGAGAPRSLQPHRQQVVFTDGWPGGTQRSTSGIYFRDVTFQDDEVIWVSTNPVRPGDSGGPLLDATGAVLGVISSGTQPSPDRDMPGEEVCVASDPRPALQQKLLARGPRYLHHYLRDPRFTRQPHVRALRLASLLSVARVRLPEMRAMLEDLDEAVAERVPPDAGLYFLRAALHQALRTRLDPFAAYRAALDVSSLHLPAAFMLAQLHLGARAYDEAEVLFTRMREAAPYRHIAAYGLALVHIGRLHYDEALPYLHEVITFDPAFGPALYHLARLHLAAGDEARARQLLVRLDDVDPFHAHRLRQTLDHPVFRPVVLTPLPPGSLEKNQH